MALLGHTLGGLVALGACGPERITYGAPRDLLLGLRFIDGRGRAINAGGKVMKNVAGYDVTRLVAGSSGTIGIITRLTLRTATRPERCAAVSASGPPKACAKQAVEMLCSSLGAVFAAAVPVDRDHGWRLQIGFEGFAETVASQIEHTQNLFLKSGFTSIGVQDYDVLTGPFADIYPRMSQCPFVMQLGVPGNRVASAALEVLQNTLAEIVLIDFGCGRVTAGIKELDGEAWSGLCRYAADLEGHALLAQAPQKFKDGRDVFGITRPEWKIMRRIKDILDPDHIFSPGKLPGKE